MPLHGHKDERGLVLSGTGQPAMPSTGTGRGLCCTAGSSDQQRSLFRYSS